MLGAIVMLCSADEVVLLVCHGMLLIERVCMWSLVCDFVECDFVECDLVECDLVEVVCGG